MSKIKLNEKKIDSAITVAQETQSQRERDYWNTSKEEQKAKGGLPSPIQEAVRHYLESMSYEEVSELLAIKIPNLEAASKMLSGIS